MADALTGVTETSASALANVAEVAQLYLQQESVLLPTVTDYSYLAVPGASSIKVPRLGSFLVGDKSENTAVDAQASTVAADTISLDQHRVIQFLIEDIADQQARINVVQEYMLRAMKDLALDMDEKILAELRTASASAPDHEIKFNDTSNEDLELVDILEARRLLIAQNINPKECFLLVGPDQEKNMLQIEQFIDASRYGAASPIMNGELGMVYGMRVLVHTSVSQEAIFYHPTACGYAFSQQMRVQEDYDLPNLARRYSMDYIAGFEVLDSGKRNVHITETA